MHFVLDIYCVGIYSMKLRKKIVNNEFLNSHFTLGNCQQNKYTVFILLYVLSIKVYFQLYTSTKTISMQISSRYNLLKLIKSDIIPKNNKVEEVQIRLNKINDHVIYFGFIFYILFLFKIFLNEI